MEKIIISGGDPLGGSVRIQGSKNAVLPMIAASLLTEEKVVLRNCPHIDDVYTMLDIMKELGCNVNFKDHVLEIDAKGANNTEIALESAKSVRSSIIFLGSLLARFKRAKLPHPGGCTIGKRPINFHIEILEKMGTVFKEDKENLEAETDHLKGADINFYKKSVGATENCILSAVLAEGVTRIKGAAIEPEITELCTFLRKMGAIILRTDYDEFLIKGVEKLHGVTYTVPTDRIVAGTYALSAVATRGRIILEDAPVSHMQSVIQCIKKMNAEVYVEKDAIEINASAATNSVKNIATENYPGFPTDLQSQLITALTVAEGVSTVEERIFESRFKIVKQLNNMGADIEIQGRKLIVNPVKKLVGTDVYAEELRGGAALVIAGVMAEGTTVINDCHYIERGYENIVGDFTLLGAKIESD